MSLLKLLKYMSTVAVSLLLTPAAHAGQVLSGRVCDYRLSTKTNTVGIPGVTVSVLQGEQLIDKQATSKDGSYAFDGVPSNTPLKIRFERAGYIRSPTIKQVKLEAKTLVMADVFLLKATDYDRVADRLKERLRREGAVREAEIAIINEFGLDAESRETILAKVDGLREVQIAQGSVRFAQAPPAKARLAVLEFKHKADNQWWHHGGTQAAQDVFVTELARSGKFSVVEREQLAALMKEKNLTLSGDIDPSTAVRIGKLVGIKYLLTGSVTEYGNSSAGGGSGVGGLGGKTKFVAAMSARLIDTSTGEIVWADEARAQEASIKVSVFGVGGGVDDERMFDKVMKPVIHHLAASLKAADLSTK